MGIIYGYTYRELRIREIRQLGFTVLLTLEKVVETVLSTAVLQFLLTKSDHDYNVHSLQVYGFASIFTEF